MHRRGRDANGNRPVAHSARFAFELSRRPFLQIGLRGIEVFSGGWHFWEVPSKPTAEMEDDVVRVPKKYDLMYVNACTWASHRSTHIRVDVSDRRLIDEDLRYRVGQVG